MERPVHEIGGVITALCQGTKDEQSKALNKYFTPDASFTHPFCRVPSFTARHLPLLNLELDSRSLLKVVYQWYRILSPHIDFNIESTVFDQRANLLYLTIHQVFTIWFIPFSLWQSHVKLVTVLKLVSLPQDENGQAVMNINGIAPGDRGVPSKYFISSQEDLYQVNEFLKFVAPWGASFLWFVWQIFATVLCALGVILFRPVTTVHEHLSNNTSQWGKLAKKQ